MEQVHWKKRVSGWDRRNTHGTKRDVDIIEFQMKWNTRRCAPLKSPKQPELACVCARTFSVLMWLPLISTSRASRKTRRWVTDVTGGWTRVGFSHRALKRKKKTPLRPVFRWSGSKNKRHMRVSETSFVIWTIFVCS